MASIDRRETKDGKVRWTMRVFIGRDGKGKRQFVVRTFDREKDALAEARRLEKMKDDGAGLTKPSKEPLASYLEHWLDGKEGKVRARTAHDYRGIIKRYIQQPPPGAPPIGSIPLNRLTPEAFETLYNWLWEQGKAPRTIQYLHVVLPQALGDAVKKRALAANPTDHASRPTRAKDSDGGAAEKAVRAMTKEQADAFLSAARDDRYYALWCVLLTGGLRPSEALGLKWSDVDFEEGRVRIQRTLTRRGVEGWRLVPTKTARSRRSVALPSIAMRALKEWRATTGKERLALGEEYENTEDLVFVSEFGRPLHQENLYKRNFARICRDAGLGEWTGEGRRATFRPAFRMYDLRHSCATLLLLAGEDLKVVSERLGHASIVLTADVYSHVLPGMQERARDRLETMFAAG